MAKKHRSNAIGMLCALLLLLTLPDSVCAQSLDLTQPVTLLVSLQKTEWTAQPVSTTATVYQLAAFTDEFLEHCVLCPAFAESTLAVSEFAAMNSQEQEQLAQALCIYAAAHDTAGITASISDTQKARFQNFPPGIYLVSVALVQDGSFQYGAEPFLVILPQKNADDSWRYTVRANPKLVPSLIFRKKLSPKNEVVCRSPGKGAASPV